MSLGKLTPAPVPLIGHLLVLGRSLTLGLVYFEFGVRFRSSRTRNDGTSELGRDLSITVKVHFGHIVRLVINLIRL